ncbi:TonB-linked outer membrane protein, SusC/RagA family [Flavobacterium fluvii]|uniref:TonB-linked outer membrane protein, SusC/RagA family n=1 Tax=Flavobacterium fluvii TaxID=468056 RepID=A0A1M5LQ23_9FLAO|nr:TonB-dependent receptor [Flavobacterium fluvii]SHG67148.1 TonB-linked outer membrane protein, SusC/RagA family [Flavobacterium fluvii]
MNVFEKGKRVIFVIMLLLGVFMGNESYAQQGTTISGVVKDETGFPLPGVNIIEKGTKNGVGSNMDGKFTLKLTTDKAVLVFSYLGYENLSVSVAGKTVVNVSLKPNAESLDEVKIVSFGYGTVKKENLTGAVSSMSAKELSKIPVTNVAEAMAGRLAGVSVQTVDGAPGADIVIRVRGGGSLTQDNSPLYVVDGFVVDNLNDVPPGDIASIDVLKDAATTAIYGAQGANGVVIVTTKKPKAGKTTVTFNQYMQIGTLPKDRTYEVLSPYEFVTMQYEKAKMTGTTNVTSFEKYFGKYDDLELYKSKKPKDWQQEALGRDVISYYTNLSLSGGSETTKFIFSYTVNDDEGLMVGSGQKRNTINFKLNHDISKKLKVDMSARISNTVVDGAGSSGSSQMRIKNILTSRPTNGIADELEFDPNALEDDDQYEQFMLGMKSPAEIIAQDWKKRKMTSYVLNAGITWNILNNLTLKSALTTEKGYGENLRFYGPETGESKQAGNSLPLGVKIDAEGHSYRFVNTLNYDFKNLGKHDLGIMLGQEVRSKGGKNQSIRVEDFRSTITPEEMFANLSLGRVDNQSTTELTDENWFSIFARATYAYDDKYLFTATVRRDASSKFEGENNVAIFPALSAGWKITSEPFLKNSKVFNELKLRVGYGEVGNDRIPANSTKLLMEPSTVKGPGFGTNANNTYYSIIGTTLYNPDLIWETTLTRNIGLDFRLFNSVINGSLEFYRNTTTDLLFKSLAYKVTGFADQWKNIGATSNRGVELSFNANIIDKKDLTLGLTMNFGINKTKIDELDGTEIKLFQSNWASTDLMSADDYRLEIGKTVGMIYGYVNDGMYTVDDFTQTTPTSAWVLKADVPSNSGIIGAPVRPGSMKLKDLNGDGAISTDDRQVIGNAVPKAQGGFGLNTTYKAFDLSMFFNWSYGNDVYNTGKIDYNQLYRTSYGNMLNTMNSANRFTYIDADGTYTGVAGNVVTDLAQLGEMNQGKTLWSGSMSFGDARPVLTDWAIEDGSYIRLNNVTLGYTLPIKDFKKTIFSSARFYVTGTNLALWTKYSGYDPDVNSNRNDGVFSALTPGLDYSSYPRSRRFTFGMNLTF